MDVDTTAWNAGIVEGIPESRDLVNVSDYGAKGDGTTDDYDAFIRAIGAVADGGTIFMPAGNYLLRAKISLQKPVAFRGEGPGETNLLINHNGHAFEVIKYKRGDWINIVGGYNKGSSELIVENPEPFKPGDYIEIQQENHPETMYTLPEWNQGWAMDAVGQIARVAAISQNKLVLDQPLRITYSADLNPVIRTQGFAEYIGFEDFSIERLDTSDTNMFYFKNAANCWVRNIHSKKAAKAHISTTTAYRIEIRDSFFDDATNWGGGGHGYGVELGFHTSDCLIENNIFKHLRHSMMVHLGANGNVFGYNYSIEPYQSEGGNWIPADISVHGHYAYSNLFEGNIAQKVTISDYWGPSGPNNTFLRNKIESNNLSIEDSSNFQNIVGNEFEKGDILWDTDGRYPHKIDISTMLMHGNYINGSIQWDTNIPGYAIPATCYIEGKPDFYGHLGWPSTGADKLGGTNPARERYYGNPISPITPPEYGDLNDDGEIDSMDLTLLKRHILKKINDFPSDNGHANADLNGDGEIDSMDLALLKRYILKKIDKFPHE
ncbi:MAG: dockerin [Clostridium sp.]|nr:dockerin [Clostridium sp.]